VADALLHGKAIVITQGDHVRIHHPGRHRFRGPRP
jgi:predicted DNA-binding protein (UPF0251 family)